MLSSPSLNEVTDRTSEQNDFLIRETGAFYGQIFFVGEGKRERINTAKRNE